MWMKEDAGANGCKYRRINASGDFLKVAHLRVFGVALWRLMVKAGVDGG
jgi:hypothetical protein